MSNANSVIITCNFVPTNKTIYRFWKSNDNKPKELNKKKSKIIHSHHQQFIVITVQDFCELTTKGTKYNEKYEYHPAQRNTSNRKEHISLNNIGNSFYEYEE